MKKVFLLLSSIILFIISLILTAFVAVDIGEMDAEGIIIFSTLLASFGTLFFLVFRKYLKTIDFGLEKWKNNKGLRMLDLILSCVSCIFVGLSMTDTRGLFAISIVSMIFFGILYIIKPLIGNTLNYHSIKSNWISILSHIILLVSSIILINHYSELRLIWCGSRFESGIVSSFLETSDNGLNSIMFLVLYGIWKFAIRGALNSGLIIAIWFSLLFRISSTLTGSSTRNKQLFAMDLSGFSLFVLSFLIHNASVLKNAELIKLNMLTLVPILILVLIDGTRILKEKRLKDSMN